MKNLQRFCTSRWFCIFLTATMLLLLFASAAFADGNAIDTGVGNVKKTLINILTLVVLAVGILELIKRELTAAIALIFAAIVIYAAGNTNIIDVISKSGAGYFGATPQ